jgi:hypothetical protein
MPVANTGSGMRWFGENGKKRCDYRMLVDVDSSDKRALIDDIHYNRILGEKKHTGTSL